MTSPARRHRGFTPWLLLVGIGALAAVIAALLAEGAEDVAELLVGATGGLLALVGLVQAWRREPHEVLLVAASIGALFGFVGLFLYAFAPQAAGVGSLITGAAGLTTTLLCSGTYAWWQRRRRGLPNLLVDEYGKDHVYELGGVQLTFVDFPEELQVGELGDIVVSLQSVVDAPRTVSLTLKSSRMRLSARRHFTCAELELTLAPGEVVAAWIPITPSALARGHADVAPILKVSGPAAKRLRWWRASPLPLPMAPLMRGLAVLIGELGALRRSGFIIEMRIPSQEDEEQEAELPLASAETIWTQEGGHVPLERADDSIDEAFEAFEEPEEPEAPEALRQDEAMDGPDPFADADAPEERR